MSDAGGPHSDTKKDSDDEPRRGPSLTLLYSLVALALIAAIAIAAVIVLPFYQRR